MKSCHLGLIPAVRQPGPGSGALTGGAGGAYSARIAEQTLSIAETLRVVLSPETPRDEDDVVALVDRAFGPGRYAKAAERLREGNRFLPDLSMTAREGGKLVGSVRLWPVAIGERPALLLGPIAVDAAVRSRGLGAALVTRACEAAAEAGHAVVVLVGDIAYFERLGFQALEKGALTLPGPADPRRILVRGLRPGVLEGLSGPVTFPRKFG